MQPRRSALAIIFTIVVIDLVGFGIVIPVLPLYAERFGASPLTIGFLLGVYSAMQAIFAPILGKLSDRFGRRPVLFLSLLGTAGGFVLMGLANSLPLLFLARIIDGVTGGNISTAQAYIADVTPPEQRSRGMGLIGAAFGLGFIIGPAVGGLLSRISLQAPFLFAAALALTNAVALIFLLPESLTPEARAARRRGPAEVTPIGEQEKKRLFRIMATYFIATTSFSLLTATYALFTARRFGLAAEQNGYIFAGQGLLGALVQGVLLGWLVKRFQDKWLVLAGASALALGLFSLPLSTAVPMLCVATACIGVGHGLMASPLNGLASKAVGPDKQGQVLGALQSTASMARIVGPVLGGALLQADHALGHMAFGRAAYWTAAGLIIVAIGLAREL